MIVDEFISLVNSTSDQGLKKISQRRGQFAFNALYYVRKDLAEQVRGSSHDPFYLDSKLEDFYKWLEKNWD